MLVEFSIVPVGVGSSIGDQLAEVLKIVDASGVLHTFSKEKDAAEFSAATANLGLLGIIYSYTIVVEPMFKLLMVSTNFSPRFLC